MSRSILIHCQPSLSNLIEELQLDYINQVDEIDVIVNDIDELDDDELCRHYGLDYDQVNCIEVA
jgi:hypothetical protein